jgi:hypothetical protein
MVRHRVKLKAIWCHPHYGSHGPGAEIEVDGLEAIRLCPEYAERLSPGEHALANVARETATLKPEAHPSAPKRRTTAKRPK